MTTPLANLWNDQLASTLSESEQLKYRSNLLGSDLRITNFGGGNTSAKVMMKDPLSDEEKEVLWVKGSGGDLAPSNWMAFPPFIWKSCNSSRACTEAWNTRTEKLIASRMKTPA